MLLFSYLQYAIDIQLHEVPVWVFRDIQPVSYPVFILQIKKQQDLTSLLNEQAGLGTELIRSKPAWEPTLASNPGQRCPPGFNPGLYAACILLLLTVNYRIAKATPNKCNFLFIIFHLFDVGGRFIIIIHYSKITVNLQKRFKFSSFPQVKTFYSRCHTWQQLLEIHSFLVTLASYNLWGKPIVYSLMFTSSCNIQIAASNELMYLCSTLSTIQLRDQVKHASSYHC